MERNKDNFLDDLRDRLLHRSVLRHRKAQLLSVLKHIQEEGTGALTGVLATTYTYDARTFAINVMAKRSSNNNYDNIINISEPAIISLLISAAIDKLDAEIAEEDAITMAKLVEMVGPPSH